MDALKFLTSIPKDAVKDAPDKRDYDFQNTFAGVAPTILPPRVVLDQTRAQNQNEEHDPSTKYGCVFYTAGHIINEENRIEDSNFQEIPNESLVKIAYDRKLINLGSGAFIQSGSKLAKDLGYISGFTNPKTLFDVKQALAMKQLVQFYTSFIDWHATFKDPNHIIKVGKCYSHSMTFEGYDDNLHGGCLIERNSMGEFGQFRGRQFLLYSDFEKIVRGSMYAYVDKLNADIIKEKQADERMKLANSRGFWNYQNPLQNATRWEVSRVAMRIAQFYNRDIPENKIWNGKFGQHPATRYELQVMFERASGRTFGFDIGNRNFFISRAEMAQVSVRV